MKKIADFLFPPRCVFCRAAIDSDGVCNDCRSKITFAERNKIKRGEFFDSGYFALWYEDNVRKSLHRFKFSGKSGYAKTYAAIMYDVFPKTFRYDALVPVPTNLRNVKKRGYNHALLLCEALSPLCGVGVTAALRKTRATEPMFGLKPHSRRANILDAFKIAAEVEGKTILIIDDILTTGSTASECARVLKSAGAKRVDVLVLAVPR